MELPTSHSRRLLLVHPVSEKKNVSQEQEWLLTEENQPFVCRKLWKWVLMTPLGSEVEPDFHVQQFKKSCVPTRFPDVQTKFSRSSGGKSRGEGQIHRKSEPKYLRSTPIPNRNLQSRLQHENLDERSFGMTRPLRGVALIDETRDLTDEDAQDPPNSLKKSFGILHDVVYMATRARCPGHHDSDRFRGCPFGGTVFGARKAAPKRRECLARTGSSTSGDRGQVGLQPCCHESRSRVDQFIHDGRAYSTRGDCQRRTVAWRRAFPFAENCFTR